MRERESERERAGERERTIEKEREIKNETLRRAFNESANGHIQ